MSTPADDLDDLTVKVWELLTTVHQPASRVGSDYWHVTRGKHVQFGKIISELYALLDVVPFDPGSDSARTVPCPDCKRKFVTNDDMLRHHKDRHP